MRVRAAPSSASLRGLDWFNFFVANVQTGFGPFVAVYLTSAAWTQGEIGTALSIGTVATIVSQLPGGALVDAMRNKRLAALLACIAIALGALMMAVWPARLSVWIAEILHGFASCMLGPAIAALSLSLVGRKALGERLGRNARYAAIGSGIAAAIMGACGTYVSEAAVFYLTAGLMVPGLLVLRMIPERRRPPPRTGKAAPQAAVPQETVKALWQLFTDHRLLIFGACVVLFHLSNAAMLPLVAGEITKRYGSVASLIIAACIVVPQLIVAMLSPAVGRAAERWGRRPALIACFLALPVRAVLLSVVDGPVPLVMVQALDGISGAGFGVLLPLLAADLTRGTNRFNLCLGALGLAAAGGATLSTAFAGTVADQLGPSSALLSLAVCGVAAVMLIVLAMPETQEAEPAEEEPVS